MSRRLVFVLGTLGLAVVLGALSVVIAFGSARSDVQRDLAAQLPDRLAEALRYSFADDEVITHVETQLRADLGQIRIDGLLPVLHACEVALLHLTQDRVAASVNLEISRYLAFFQNITVPWERGLQGDHAAFVLTCELDMPVLIGSHLLMALLLMSSWSLLPPALNRDQQALYDALIACGLRAVDVRRVMQALPAPDRQAPDPWVMLVMRAYAQDRLTLSAALEIAQAPAVLCFNHHSQCVVIHGLSIALPKTPYFYYAWYATYRQQNIQDGWILNPAVDRPDRGMANSLIRLMEAYGGHQKAINDLREHGLRSKILDQNRNKIKDELGAVLGEELASEFLFEAERDVRSGRYRYRLACAPGQILLQPDSPCTPVASL